MDDYLKALLAEQNAQEEQTPGELKKLLEQQGSPRQETRDEDPGEKAEGAEGAWLLEGLEAPEAAVGMEVWSRREENSSETTEETPKEAPKGEATVGEEIKGEASTALEDTASRRFLEVLEREITSLSYGSGTAVVIRQPQETAVEEPAVGTHYRTAEVQRAFQTLSPEGLSRVFQRDARRYP